LNSRKVELNFHFGNRNFSSASGPGGPGQKKLSKLTAEEWRVLLKEEWQSLKEDSAAVYRFCYVIGRGAY
jgi:hypothetical protein